jgi:hypothetical protein
VTFAPTRRRGLREPRLSTGAAVRHGAGENSNENWRASKHGATIHRSEY